MHFKSNILGFVVCVLVLMGSGCAARRPNRQGQKRSGQYVTSSEILSSRCRDIVDVAYCKAVKKSNRCNIHAYKKNCKLTCGVCTSQSESLPRIEDNTECRDIGTEEFCMSVKPACERQRYGVHQRSRFAMKYCKKTCGFCAPQPTKKPEITCVDRPICQKLTVFYKIKSCSTLPHQLRKRAMRKCPKLCGLCVVAEKNEPEVALAIRPVVDIVETPQTITTSNNRNRPPHPPIENRETDNEPRRGVFYIYTKYLSL